MIPVACSVRRRVPAPVRRRVFPGHAAACLRCQAQGVRRRRLDRELRRLATVVEPAPPGLLAAVMGSLDIAPVTVLHRSHLRRRLATGGALALAAAGAAVVAVRRHRPAHG